MKEPLLSIIMPAYNVGSYIKKAIDAVLAQSYENFELIVVDDGSTDNTYSIVKELYAYDPRILLLKKDNGGLSDARNFGFERSKGDFIHFYDSDDTIDQSIYIASISSLENTGADIVVFGYTTHHIYKENTISKIQNLPVRGTYVDKDANNDIIISNETYLNFAWNKIYKREQVLNYRFTKGLKLIEDIDFNSRVLLNAKKIIFLDCALYNYIVRPTQTLSKFYSDELAALCIQRQELRLNYYNGFLYSDKLKKRKLALKALSDYRVCFSSIYSYGQFSTKSEYQNAVKTILRNKELRRYLSFEACNNLKSIIVYLSVQLKASAIIHQLYKYLIRQ